VLVIDGKNNNDVGRFTGRVCMARTTTKTQKSKLEKLRRNSVSMQRSKLGKKRKLRRRSEKYAKTRNLQRDSSFQKCRRGPSHQDSQKDQRSRYLTLRNSSKSGGCVSSGGGATVAVGSPIPNTRCSLDKSPMTQRKHKGEVQI
jgi:hypothetical protein